MIVVTMDTGFIGGKFILDWLTNLTAEGIVNVDKFTYTGNLEILKSLKHDVRHLFTQGDIGD